MIMHAEIQRIAVYRIIGAGGRFVIPFAFPMFLDAKSIIDMGILVSGGIVFSVLFSAELYHLFNRKIVRESINTQFMLSAHFSVLVVWQLILTTIFLLSTSGTHWQSILIGLSLCWFQELYRYSGVLERPIEGHRIYALRGGIAIVGVIIGYLFNARGVAFVTMIYVLSDTVPLLFVRYVPALRFLITVGLKEIRANIWTQLKILPSSIIIRFQQNFDRIFMLGILGISAHSGYVQTVMIAAASVSLVEPIVTNNVIGKYLKLKIGDKDRCNNYKIPAVLGFVFSLAMLFVCDRFKIFEVDYVSGTMCALSASMLLYSNHYYLLLYSRGKDGEILIDNLSALLVSLVIFFVLYEYLDSSYVYLQLVTLIFAFSIAAYRIYRVKKCHIS